MPTDPPDALIGLTLADLAVGRSARRTSPVPPRAFDLAAAMTGLPPFYPLDGPPTADEALLLLQGYAFRTDRSIDDIAYDIVHRRLPTDELREAP